jgi:hypothetical protein
MAFRVDREPTKPSEQLTMQFNNHVRVNRLPFIVGEWHVEPARAEEHEPIILQARMRSNLAISAKPEARTAFRAGDEAEFGHRQK